MEEGRRRGAGLRESRLRGLSGTVYLSSCVSVRVRESLMNCREPCYGRRWGGRGGGGMPMPPDDTVITLQVRGCAWAAADACMTGSKACVM